VALVRQTLIASGQPQDTWGPADTNDRGTHKEPLVDASGNWVTQPVASLPVEMNPWLGDGDMPVVAGDVTMQIDARDVDTAAGALDVWVEIDGGLPIPASYQASMGVYQVAWDTTGVSEGEHTVVAFARDIDNNMSDSAALLTTNEVTVLVDNLSLPSVSVAATADAAEAGDSGSFTVSRTGNNSDGLVVYFAVDPDASSADYGDDYSLNPTDMITIPAGSSSATVEILPVDDDLTEGTEDLVLILVADASYELENGADTATVLIFDNDGATSYEFVSDDVPLDIPDPHPRNGPKEVTSELTVDSPDLVHTVEVDVVIDHALMSDVGATLTSPSSSEVALEYTAGQWMIALDAFQGEVLGGTWTLTVWDEVKDSITGVLQSWSLIVTPQPSAAAGRFGAYGGIAFVTQAVAVEKKELPTTTGVARLVFDRTDQLAAVDAYWSQPLPARIPRFTPSATAVHRHADLAIDRVLSQAESSDLTEYHRVDWLPSLELL
jgi:subtilisin-like proprotein convertase family protein